MRRIKLIVAYDGTEYSGWQIQPEAPTIEMYLDKAIHELTGENVHVTGANKPEASVPFKSACDSCKNRFAATSAFHNSVIVRYAAFPKLYCIVVFSRSRRTFS